MENLKNIQPVEDFNWDAFEQGETYTEVSKDDLVKTYDETLNTVKDKEVVMGTVTSMNKREVVVNIVSNLTVLFLCPSSVITRI